MAHVRKSSVSLRITGDDLVPQEITKLLGVEPTLSYAKGDKLLGSKTGPVRIAKFGMWSLKALPREPEDMDSQIQEILHQTTNDLAVWRDITSRYEIDLFCGIFLGCSNEGMMLSAQSLAALGERGIELGLDIYAVGIDPRDKDKAKP